MDDVAPSGSEVDEIPLAPERTASEFEVPLSEIVKLGAADTIFFGRAFFPKTFKQATPEFHRSIIETVEPTANRFVGIKVYRDGAKTTLLRVVTAKRISYGLSRTVLYISESQAHSIKSLKWFKSKIEQQDAWSVAFGLRQGSKWTDEWIEIHNTVLDVRINIMAFGITGQVRGVNIDDARPDLIIIDDVCSEENSATSEQRNKISDLIFGAVQHSLTPASENPHAKMVMLQTPIDREDVIEMIANDPQWHCATFGCFDQAGQSRWPARTPTDVLLADKESFIRRNQLSLWLREKECVIISPETCAFNATWLKMYVELPEEGLRYFIAIDPTPPPKDTQVRASNKLDDFAIVVGAIWGQRKYLIEYYVAKSPNDAIWLLKLFELVIKYRPVAVGVETILFARTVKTAIEKEMKAKGIFFLLVPYEDKRKKQTRIVQAINGPASNGLIHVHPSHQQFISQFQAYPNVSHDDLLDAFAIFLELSGKLGQFVGEDESASEPLAVNSSSMCP